MATLANRWGIPADEAEDAASDAIAAVAMFHVDADQIFPVLAIALYRYVLEHALTEQREADASRRYWHSMELHVKSVEEEVFDEQALRALLTTARLSRQEQTVVLLRCEGHPYNEVARRIGLTPKASQRSFERARTKLRRVLGTPRGPASAGPELHRS